MTTLKQLIASIQYDSNWGIWAELIEGQFNSESEARYGQRQFDNGGLLDNFEFFAHGESCGDFMTSWNDGTDDETDDEWIDEMIDNVNQGLND